MNIALALTMAIALTSALLYVPTARSIESAHYLETAILETEARESMRPVNRSTAVRAEKRMVEQTVPPEDLRHSRVDATAVSEAKIGEPVPDATESADVIPVTPDLELAAERVTSHSIEFKESPERNSESKPEEQESDAENDVINLVEAIFHEHNQYRVAAGLTPLLFDTALSLIATKHSLQMAQADFFAHQDEEGCSLRCRLEENQYSAVAWGENIIYLDEVSDRSADELAGELFQSWLESSGHLKNIRNQRYTHVGIGVAQAGGRLYVTVDFALPR